MNTIPQDGVGGSTGRVAITGATGFVGTHAVKQLLASGRRVVALTRSTSNLDRLRSLGVECRNASLDDIASLTTAMSGCETVFHLAGAVAFHGDWRHFHQVNVVGTANVLRAAERAGIRRAIVTSSIVAVGANRHPSSLDESADWNLRHLKIPYVTTKRQAEELALGESFGRLEVVVVNPSCVVGPGDDGSEFGVIMHRFWRGRVPFYFGGGANFVDVRDVAFGLLAAADRGRPGERYLLAGTNVAWSDFFLALSRVAGRAIPRLRLPNVFADWIAAGEAKFRGHKSSRPNLTPEQAKMMPYYFHYRCDKAKRELGYHPRPLNQTLADAYASWSEQPSRRRAG